MGLIVEVACEDDRPVPPIRVPFSPFEKPSFEDPGLSYPLVLQIEVIKVGARVSYAALNIAAHYLVHAPHAWDARRGAW